MRAKKERCDLKRRAATTVVTTIFIMRIRATGTSHREAKRGAHSRGERRRIGACTTTSDASNGPRSESRLDHKVPSGPRLEVRMSAATPRMMSAPY